MFTPTFKTMTANATGYSLSDIVPVGDGVEGTGDIQISIMGANGKWIGEYFWFTMDGYGLEDGWYTIGEDPANVALAPGHALVVSCSNDDVQFKVFGEVVLTDAALSVNQGYTIFGNASPSTVHISEIVPKGNVEGTGDIMIQFMSAQGKWTGEYFWFTEDGYGLEDGWYTSSDEPADETLLPGASFVLSCDNAGVTFTVPAPID